MVAALSAFSPPRLPVPGWARGLARWAAPGYRPGAPMSPPVSTYTFASDAELVSALAAGRRDALAPLYDRYAPMLLAVGLRMHPDRREIEDIVHDVFVEAWRAAAQFDPARGTVRAWLVTRMRSRVLDRRKSAGVSRSVSLDASGYEWLAGGDDPAAQPDHARVRAAMETLSAEQRQVLSLAYFEGLSCSEIAERAELPIGTVKSRAAAALARLREQLGAPREGA